VGRKGRAKNRGCAGQWLYRTLPDEIHLPFFFSFSLLLLFFWSSIANVAVRIQQRRKEACEKEGDIMGQA
jgi:hypothetical protein